MIPNSVNVVGVEYTVEIVEGLCVEHGVAGACHYDTSKIKIDSSLSESKKEQTFIHELTHAIFNEAGFEEQKESMINRLGIVLYQVLKQNKLYFSE